MAITPQDKRDIRLRVPLNEVPHIDLVTPVTDFQRVNELGEHDLVGALSPQAADVILLLPPYGLLVPDKHRAQADVAENLREALRREGALSLLSYSGLPPTVLGMWLSRPRLGRLDLDRRRSRPRESESGGPCRLGGNGELNAWKDLL